MRHLEDKRLCPHCLAPLHHQPYLMARQATENVLTWTQVAWVVAAIALLALLAS